jgi:hypothetical protein
VSIADWTTSWFLPVCALACSCASSTCTTAPDSCFLDYCNAHSDIQGVICGGST